MLQAIHCPACDTCFRGEYLEERRGARDRVTHSATPISADLFARYLAAIKAGDEDLALKLAGTEPGVGTCLQYKSPNDSAPLSRATTPSFRPVVSPPPPASRVGWLQRLRKWVIN